MNCRPGDLAFIVNVPPVLRYLAGRVVKVSHVVLEGSDWCWEYEGRRLTTPAGSPFDLIEDEFLRPIRPGGVTGDEVRELYALKPVERAVERKPVHAGYPEA